MRFASVLAVLALILPVAATAQSGLSISNYQLQSSTPVGGSIVEETYTGLLFNSGGPLTSVTATLTSNDSSIVVIPGRNVLNFAPVPATSAVSSNNTFTIRVDRSQSVFFSQLRWAYTVGAANPIANAGQDQTVKFKQTVNLNGSGSTNPSGQGTLTYSWTFVTVPVGSTAVLSGANTATPSFVANPVGQYVVRLTVSNGSGSSSANVTINATNTAPVANAGPAQSIAIGSTVTLNGTASTDVDGNPLTYAWTLQTRPAGSSAALANSTSATPTFVADQAGNYTVSLVVSDSALFSTPATVTITTTGGNTRPVANAGSNRSVTAGTVVSLSGAASTDVDGNPLTYSWSFNSRPAGSAASLSSPTAVNPSFTADLAGDYIVQLVVNDGQLDSIPVTVTISTTAIPTPTANAGVDQHVALGTLVTVAGTGTDPLGRPLTKQYTLTSKPQTSTASIVLNGSGDATFVADKAGDYVVQLIVTTGTVSSAPDTMTVSTNNTAPIANPGVPLTRAVGASVDLDGRGSTDADGDALTYLWSLTTRPAGSNAALSGATTSTPSFVADLAGQFVVQLIVNDGKVSSAPQTMTVTAVAPNSISLTPNPVTMTTQAPVTVAAQLSSPAASPGVTVSLTTLPGAPSLVDFPSTIFFPTGTTDQTFTITPLAAGTTTILAIVPNMQPVNLAVNVTGATLALTLDTNVIGLGNTVTGHVTRSITSGSPLTVNLAANPGNVTVPATVVIPAGASTANFSVVGASTGFADLTASASGFTSANVSVQVAQLGQINLPSNVALTAGQASVPYSVTLSTPAGPQGVRVHLTSSNPSVVTISPSDVDVAAGAFGPSISPQVTGVAFGAASITATAPGYQDRTQGISVTGALSFNPSPANLLTNSPITVTAQLAAAVAAPLTVNLTLFSGSSVATFPSSITFPQGASETTFTLTPTAAGSMSILATGSNLQPTSLPVNVTGSSLALSLDSSVIGLGNSTTGRVTRSTATAAAVTVTLTPSNNFITVNPTTVTIPANATTSDTFSVQGVAVGAVDLTASASGYTSSGSTVVVTQLGQIVLPSAMSISPGQSAAYSIHLSSPAGASGVVVTLSSSNSAAVTISPAQVTFPANSTLPTVTPQVTGVGFGSANIIASSPGYIAPTQPVTVGGTLSWGQELIAGGTGTTRTATLVLNSPASTNLTVNLSSDNAAIASVPPTATFTAGTSSTSITVTLGSAGNTTLRASGLPTLAETSIPVTVANLGSIVLPVGQTIGAGASATFPISISQPAPSGGVTIALNSSDTGKVTITPSSVTIAQGQTQPASQPIVTGVALGSANIQASGPGVGSTAQTVSVRATSNLSPSTLTINGVGTQNLTLNLGAPAPSDVVVQMTSGNPLVATVPATITIPTGATSVLVPVTSVGSGEVAITATPAAFYNPASSSVLVFISVAGNIAIAGTTDLTLGQTSTIPVSISPAAGAGGVTITLASNNPAVTVTSTVTIPQGATVPTTLPSVTGVNFGSATITATAGGYTPGTRTVNVGGALSFGSAPVTISGTSTVTLVLSLPSSAPSAFTVNLSSSNAAAATVPPTATFAAGASTVNVPVTGVAPGTSNITASAAGVTSASTTVQITPTPDISIPAGFILGPGQDRTFPITLKTAAPAGGVYVSLASSNTSKVTISPPLVYVPEGTVTSIATPRVTAVDFGSAIISATAPGLLGDSQSVQVAIQMSFLQPNISISGVNGTQTLALSLSAPSPAGGATVNLVSNNPGVARIQQSIFIPANVSIVSVLVTGMSPGVASITASGGIVGSATATVRVLAPGTMTLGSNVTVAVGQYAKLPITLGAPATAPVTVTLTSSNSRKLFVSSSVVIPAGATEPVDQPVVGADNIGVVTITATAPGFQPATAQVSGTTTITWAPTSISMAPAEERIVLLALAMPAPPGHTQAGRCEIVDSDFCSTTIFLSSDNVNVARVQPEVTYYPDGSNPSTAQLVVTAGTPGTTIIHAHALPYVQEVLLSVTVLGPGAIALPGDIVLSPGQVVSYPVSLSSAAPGGGLTVSLASNDNSKVTISPSSVFIPAGATVPASQPQVTGVNFGSANITATAANFASATQAVQVRGTLTLNPPTLNLTSGNGSLNLTLSAPAPAPLTVTLTSSNPSVVAVASSVTISTGSTGVVVGLSTGASGTAQVTASAGPQITPATANITVGNVNLGGVTLAAGLSTSPGQTISLPLSLTNPAPTGGVTVTLTSANGTATVTPSVFIPAGATSPAAQPQVTGVLLGNASITASAPSFTPATQTVAVGAALSFASNSISVVRTASKNLQLILSAPAPAGGVVVNLNSSNTAIATVASSATIAAGATSINVSVTGVALGTSTISASSGAGNVSGASATVTVTNPDIQIPASLTVSVGSQVPVPVTLSQPAPAGGVSVVLTSSDTNKATINPSTVFIAQGGTTPVTQPVAIGVSAGTVVVAASANGLVGSSANLQVGAGISFAPPSLTISGSGTSQFLQLNLPSAAPVGGQVVNLVSSNTSVATVPAFVNVPQGVSSFNISVTSVGAGSTTITATASGLPGATAAVTVTGGSAINLPVGLQVPMGPGALFPITLGSPAPPGGVTLTLTVGNPSRAAISPSSVYVPAGATTPNVQPTVSALNVGPNTITVAGSGYGTATANITGTATVQFVSGTTTTVRLGETGRLYMALGAAAPPGHTIAGRCEIVDSDFCSISVNLTAVTPGVVYVQPQFTYYPDGSNPPIGLVLFSPTAVGTTILKAGAPPYIPETTITVTVTN